MEEWNINQYTMVFLLCDWLYFLWFGINSSIWIAHSKYCITTFSWFFSRHCIRSCLASRSSIVSVSLSLAFCLATFSLRRIISSWASLYNTRRSMKSFFKALFSSRASQSSWDRVCQSKHTIIIPLMTETWLLSLNMVQPQIKEKYTVRGQYKDGNKRRQYKDGNIKRTI